MAERATRNGQLGLGDSESSVGDSDSPESRLGTRRFRFRIRVALPSPSPVRLGRQWQMGRLLDHSIGAGTGYLSRRAGCCPLLAQSESCCPAAAAACGDRRRLGYPGATRISLGDSRRGRRPPPFPPPPGTISSVGWSKRSALPGQTGQTGLHCPVRDPPGRDASAAR